MHLSRFAYRPPQRPVKVIVAREAIILVLVALALGVVWVAGNYAIAYLYRPQIADVKQAAEELKKKQAALFDELHREKVRLFVKVFTERYDPRQPDTETEEQLMRIYNRYAADDTKFLTYLFRTRIPVFSYDVHKAEIAAFQKELDGQVAALSERTMRPYEAGSRDLAAIRDGTFQRLYAMYWWHNLLLWLILALAYPVRFMVKGYRWAFKMHA
jgi:hypothetical protein